MISRSAHREPPEQRDLFEQRGDWCNNDGASPKVEDTDWETLDNQILLERVASAKLSNVETVCSLVLERKLGDAAVPALIVLWNRFRGFGIKTPLLEQQLALETLSEIGTATAKAAIRKILIAPDLPDSLLPCALLAATSVTLSIPFTQIASWLEHDAPIVRALAFTLVQSTNPPKDILEMGLTDPEPSVQRAVLITAGNLGHRMAKPGLLAEFRKNPTSRVIQALLTIADEDIIIKIGHYASGHAAHRALIAKEFEMLDNAKAKTLAQRIKTQIKQRSN